MADFSAKHYMIKSEKNAIRAGEEADRAESYANSLHPDTFVKTSGNQTIDGIKTFINHIHQASASPRVIVKDTTLERGQAGDGGDAKFQIVDKNNSTLGEIRAYNETNGATSFAFSGATSKADGSQLYKTGLLLTINPDGTSAISVGGVDNAYSKTPATNSNSTNIATTAWVRNAGAVTTAKSLAANGYVKLSSGLIIQWGYTTSNNSTVTFPTAFTAVPSLTFGGFATGGSADYSIVYKSITATNFSVAWAGSAYTGTRWIAVGY